MFKVDGRTIGTGEPVFMIAEIGINHNGDMQIAKRLIDAAFACGWDCVKFQKRDPDLCVPENQKNVLRKTPWGEMTYLEYKKKIEFEEREYNEIDLYCRLKPVLWSASVWDLNSLNFILDYDVPFVKVPSAKMVEHDLLLAIANVGKPVIMSTGMSTVQEIDESVNILETYLYGNYALMHTNSAYPSPPKDINLRAIAFLKERYGCVVGYSGHEYGLDPTVLSVSFGADIIERHITLDHTMWGTDQAASLEVHAMDMLHKRIKEAAVCLGDGIKRVADSEIPIRDKLRG
jgi:N-acetylneuraminate synthase